MNNKKSYRINILLIVLIAFIVLFLSLKDNFSSSINYLLNLRYIWLIVAIFFVSLNIIFQSISQYRFLKEVKEDYKFSSCVRLIVIAMFFNAITPFSSGGQPFEVYLLNKEGIKVSDSANALLQNFITYQFALIVMGTVSIIINLKLNIIPSNLLLKKVVIIGYIVNVAVMTIIVLLSRAKRINTKIFSKIFNFVFSFKFIKNKEDKKAKAEKMLDDFYNSTAIMKNNFKNTIISFFSNLCSLICVYTVPYFIFIALGNGNLINLIESIVSSSYTFLIGSFIPIPGGSGGLEYGYMDFFKVFATGGLLSSSMLLWRILTYYFGAIIGGITLVTYRRENK